MTARFFAQSVPEDGTTALDSDEAHHLRNVLRMKENDPVQLFDGNGHRWNGRVGTVGKKEVVITALVEVESQPELARPIILATPIPKGDRQKWLVEKATELGISRLVPLRTERSTFTPNEKNLRKLEGLVINASKQSGRDKLMAIDHPTSLKEFLSEPSDSARRWFADLAGAPVQARLGNDGNVEGTWCAVGPEGGWTENERQLAVEHGWLAVGLGPSTLRMETACLAITVLASQG